MFRVILAITILSSVATPPVALGDAEAGSMDLTEPPLSGESPVIVRVGVYILNLAAVDEVKETFQIDGYLTAVWKDDRVKYSPSPRSLLRSRTFHEEQIWYPHLSMLNAAEPRSKFDVTIRARPDGTATYRERFVVTLSTKFDVARFPFDSQKLTIYLQPIWADREIMTLVSDRDLLQLNQAEYVGMSQWNIKDLSQRTTSENVGGTSEKISQVAFTILVKRRYGFYIWKVFVPLLLMVTVSWTIFWMGLDDFGNQILVAITTILTVIAFAFSIESNLPKVPYVTYIDAFFLCCYIFVFLTVIELMAVNLVLRTGGKQVATKIRRYARWSVPIMFALLNAILIPHFFLR
jgi:hypothetical protein